MSEERTCETCSHSLLLSNGKHYPCKLYIDKDQDCDYYEPREEEKNK